MINEIQIVKLVTKVNSVRVHTDKNVKIQQIVFSPNENIIYIQLNGKWKKVSYMEVK